MSSAIAYSRNGTQPRQALLSQRWTNWSLVLDANQGTITDNPTARAIAAILSDVDDGEIGEIVQMSEEIEAKDAQTQTLLEKRRRAYLSSPWKIVPATENPQDIFSANFIEQTLNRVKVHNLYDNGCTPLGINEFFKHLSYAIGPGLSISELVWKRSNLDYIVNVPGRRIRSDPRTKNQVLIRTDQHLTWGEPIQKHKFVIHAPQSRTHGLVNVSLARANALLWLLKTLARNDWASFLEVFGKPLRIATVPKDTPPDVRTNLHNALRRAGSEFCAVVDEGIALSLTEAQRGTEPFSKLVEWAENKQSILILGQNLSTEQATTGSYAMARVHMEVLGHILLADIEQEKQTIESQLFRSLLDLRFPGQNRACPNFVRTPIQEINLDVQRLTLEKLKFMKEMALHVPKKYIYDELSVPMEEESESEDRQEATSNTATTINELTLGIERAVRAGDIALVNLIRNRIASLLGTTIEPLTNLPSASATEGVLP